MIDIRQWFLANEVRFSVYDAQGNFVRFDTEAMVYAAAEAVLNENQPARQYGSIKDTADGRDKVLSLSADIPASASEFASLGPVRDQGSESSCVGHGWAGFADWLFKRYGAHHYSVDFSPQFLYYQVRKLEGTLPTDTGAQIRSGAKILNQIGAVPENEDVYGPQTLNQEPAPNTLVDAQKFRAGAYHRVPDVTSMRQCLASGYCFVIGIEVFESFESSAVAKSGEVPLPGAREQSLGGHCILCWGYTDEYKNPDGSLGAFAMRNSWGDKWGKNGNFWIPYSYVEKYAMDAWTQHFGHAWAAK